MGDDVTKKSIEMHLSQNIRPMGRLQKAARASGNDPKDITLKVNHKTFDGQEPYFLAWSIESTRNITITSLP